MSLCMAPVLVVYAWLHEFTFPMLQQVELDEYVHVQLYIASYAYLLTTFEIDLA